MFPKRGFWTEKKSHVAVRDSDAARSSPSNKTDSSLRGILEEVLECPVCMNFMHPPIHQVLICSYVIAIEITPRT